MFDSKRLIAVTLGLILLAMVSSQVTAQGGRGFGGGRGFRGGRGGGPPGQDARFVKDRDDFHYLLQHHDQIRRTVTNRDDGVETLTESDDAEIAAKIQEHVDAMYGRVEDGRPIHMRDPLFAAVFRHADKIKMEMETTDKGVRVIETSEDPYVARLIQAHAQVVNLFVKNGFGEPHKNHAVPERDGVTSTPTSNGQASAKSGNGGDADRPCPAATCPAAGDCPNAGKCPLAKPACCAAGICKGTACPLSDVCPHAKSTSVAESPCDSDQSCPGAACPAAGNCPCAAKCPNAANCPNAAKCSATKPACCANRACQGTGCPLDLEQPVIEHSDNSNE